LTQGLTGFSFPQGVAVDPNSGNLYVADGNAPAVMVFTANGAPVTTLTGFTYPADVALDHAGNIYVADNGGVVKLDSSYSLLTTIGTVSSVGSLRGLWVDDQGTTQSVYMSGAGYHIYRYDGSGSAYSSTATFGDGLQAPTGLVKAGNKIYVADTSNNQVVAFDESSNYSPTTVLHDQLFAPYGIRTDPAGYFYVAGNELRVFLPDFSLDHICQVDGGAAWGIGFNNNSGIVYLAEPGVKAVTTLQACVIQPTPVYQGTQPPSTGQCFIYPSPARGNHASLCYFMDESGRLDLKIWNEKGELADKIQEQKAAGVQVTTFSVSTFATGVYFYQATLSYSSGRVVTLKPRKFAVIH
jgi:sugar lactone lactonase YvrE